MSYTGERKSNAGRRVKNAEMGMVDPVIYSMRLWSGDTERLRAIPDHQELMRVAARKIIETYGTPQ